MTTLAAALKKDLKQNFKDIKFSVTTKRNDVGVAWEMTLGTTATKQAVKEICKKHETVQYHGSLIDDTAWSSGTGVYYHPSYTQEMKDSAVAGVIDYNKFADATWDDRYERFVQADGKEHLRATKLFYYYVENGVASQLIDEYGNEPSDKRWYYEKLNTPAPIELEPVLQPEPDSAPDCISLEEWVATKSKRNQLEEESALKSEIWELQQRLIALQLKHSKTNR